MESITLSKLIIYPLKSAKGVALDKMEIDTKGPRWDREWMLVNKATGRFVSQRTHPIMSQVQVELTQEDLQISFQGFQTLSIPLQRQTIEKRKISIFDKETLGELVSEEADQWFSEILKGQVQLVRSPEDSQRQTSGNHGPIAPLRFPDGYPFLLTSESTLAELNSRLESPVEMNRFRPNIVITGGAANAEDLWQEIAIGGIRFLPVKACTRCAIIDVDQESGTKDKTVSKELKSYRTKDGSIIFGMNLTHKSPGEIQIQDSVRIIS